MIVLSEAVPYCMECNAFPNQGGLGRGVATSFIQLSADKP